MRRIIKAKELGAKDTVALARWLLGKHLVRRRDDGTLDARMITEVEAYDGEHDLACHARVGRTLRTAVMYEPGGVWYVYLCYGIHEMLNLVVGARDWPAAVLIRGVEGASGPGRVTKALAIDRQLNRTMATARASGLWLEDRGGVVPEQRVRATPRIGVDYAGPIWAKKPWRFIFEPPAPERSHAAPRPRKSGRAPRRAA
jgi:DNA-3-methyladenine glycosylase